MSRRFGAVFVPVFMLLTGLHGLREGAVGLRTGGSTLRQLAAYVEIGYGILGFVAVVVLWTRPRWARIPVLGWAGALIAAGTLAPIARGGGSVLAGILVGMVTALLVGLVARMALLPTGAADAPSPTVPPPAPPHA
ncbi:MAG TPA: hypothetical protein VNK43_12965 [Gemmatimonadales bacterium]|nr:hypothetical protein [Gemmatimonadales bacterium]